MATDLIPATAQSTDEKRGLALLKAVGLDKVAPETRELALAIADRYGLDLMLRHLVIVDGKPYITRDGLLHIAHRSGVFDGIEVTPPVKVDRYWRAVATVWRKDMSRGFTYPGRYPAGAKNDEEMGIKVAESMALRRAFDVSAPTLDERWSSDDAAPVDERPRAGSLADVARARAVAVQPAPEPPAPEPPAPEPAPAPVGRCPALSPHGTDSEPCAREAGHDGPHRNHERESWS